MFYVKPSNDGIRSPDDVFSLVLGRNKLNNSIEVDSEIRKAFDLDTSSENDVGEDYTEENSQATFDKT